MIVPTRLAVAAVLAATALCAGAVVHWGFAVAGLGLDVAIIGLVVFDGWRARVIADRDLTVRLDLARTLSVGRAAAAAIVLEHRGAAALTVDTEFEWPDGFEAPGDHTAADPVVSILEPRSRAVVRSSVLPRLRGRHRLQPVIMTVRQARAFGAWRGPAGEPTVAMVRPDLAGVRAFDALARGRGLARAGVHRRRTIGAGRDFDQIREYVPGDDHRDVNWKTTARTGRPHTNLFREDRRRDVIICVDAGRQSTQPAGERTVLDLAVETAMLLTWVAGSSGDDVGLMTYRDRIADIVRPGRGPVQSRRLLDALTTLQSAPVFTNHRAIASRLRTVQRRRSLVIMLTDLGDPHLAEHLVATARQIAARHVVLVVAVEDASLARTAAAGPTRDADVATVLAAASMLRERREHQQRLVERGIQLVVADPKSFALDAVNRYLDVRSRQLV